MADELRDYAELYNQNLEGWTRAAGLRLLRATVDEVTAELEVAPHHLQAYGIVHGGVYAGVIETLASIGAALNALPRGDSVVGLENHTTFLKAVRSGKLRAVAKPLTRGRRTQVWEGTVENDEGRAVATGRVRLLVLAHGTELAGEAVAPTELPR